VSVVLNRLAQKTDNDDGVSSINPFSGYIAQGGQVERGQVADKTRQVRREQVLSKNVAARDDELEHQVESADAVVSIHDDQNPSGQQQPKQQRPQKDPSETDGEEPPRLDVTA
jgi:hypothetical protein